jgi:TolA-binding protein
MNGPTTASTFWAQKSREVTTCISPALAVAEPREKMIVAPEPNHRKVLKGKSLTGKCAASTDRDTGMPNWADSDDDDFVASFSGKKNTRITTLEQEAAKKDIQLEELEASIRTKDMRIEHLEHNIEDNEQQNASLRLELDAKVSAIDELNNDRHTQFLYVKELVAELDEKSRRIQELEVDVDEKAARIHDLEMESDSQTQTSTEDSEKIDLSKHAGLHNGKFPVQVANIAHRVPEPTSETPVVDGTTAPIITQPETMTTTTVAPDAPSTDNSTGPTANDAKFPMMWSPDTPKKVAPVEKPKVLRMAIDTSKFGKKSTLVTQQSTQVVVKAISASSYGQSTKHRSKTDVMPVIDVSKDIRQMPHRERVLYANGPDVSVLVGTTRLATIPKYILMQCSERAYKHFTKDQNATSITFPVGSMDVDATKAHLRWMDEMTYQGRVYSLALHTDERLNEKNLKICQAARVMGLNSIYVGHFTKAMCDRVRSNNCSPEFVSQICELAHTGNDPIFDCLSNNLVNQQMSKSTKKPNEIDSLLNKYPLLREKIVKIEQRVKGARTADNRRVS